MQKYKGLWQQYNSTICCKYSNKAVGPCGDSLSVWEIVRDPQITQVKVTNLPHITGLYCYTNTLLFKIYMNIISNHNIVRQPLYPTVSSSMLVTVQMSDHHWLTYVCTGAVSIRAPVWCLCSCRRRPGLPLAGSRGLWGSRWWCRGLVGS